MNIVPTPITRHNNDAIDNNILVLGVMVKYPIPWLYPVEYTRQFVPSLWTGEGIQGRGIYYEDSDTGGDEKKFQIEFSLH